MFRITLATALCSGRIAALLLLLGSLLACSTPIKVGYNATPGVDFQKYKTYAWMTEDLMSANDPLASSYISPIDDARVRGVVDKELAPKGITGAPLDQADMVIAFTVTREQKTSAFVDPGVRVYYPSTVGPYTYGGMAVDVDQYTEGTLKFDIFDRKTHELIWTGFGSKRLTKNHEPPETIELAVQQIFTKYPPPAP